MPHSLDVLMFPLLLGEQEGSLAGTGRSSFSAGFFINELIRRSVGVLLPELVELDSKFHSELLRLESRKHPLPQEGAVNQRKNQDSCRVAVRTRKELLLSCL